jgi:phosphate starvation-inducible PhoH-like protein
MSKRARRFTRKERVQADQRPAAKEKFVPVPEEETFQNKVIPKFEPANQNQKLAVNMLKEGRSVVVLRGSAGTGKSMIAAHHAASQMKNKSIDKIWLLRPAVPTGNTIGLLKGDEKEKLLPYFIQTLQHLKTFMGEGYLQYCIEKQKVEMKAVEYLRGYSFENCIVIVEESQNFTKDDMEMVLTRLGKNATIIFTGDEKQHDLRGVSGLEQTVELITRTLQEEPDYMSDEDLDEIEFKFGVVTFTPDDVMRSGLTRAFVKMYYNTK